MAESSKTAAQQRTARVAKRLKCTTSPADVDDGAASRAEQTTTDISGTAVQHTKPSTGKFPFDEDDSLLKNILSYVGDFQFLFIGSVNPTFEKSYASLFPTKSTYINASTIEHAMFCWNNIDGSIKDDDETKRKQRRRLWHSAIRYGKIDVVKHLFHQLPPPKDISFKTIQENKDREKFDWRYDLCYKAAKHGHMDLFQWACDENNCVAKDDRLVCLNAIAHGHFELFHRALKYGFVFDHCNIMEAAFEACMNGQLEALQYLVEHHVVFGSCGDRDSSCGCCNAAASKGQLAVLKWLNENLDSRCDSYTLSNAISSGHFESVKYLLDHGCDPDDEACDIAATSGSLDVLKLLVSLGCEWEDSVIDYAAAGGYLDIIEWANDNDCPSSELACAHAASFGQLDTLKWLRARGCPWDEETTRYASTDEIYDWAKSNGCPVADGNPREELKLRYGDHIVNWSFGDY